MWVMAGGLNLKLMSFLWGFLGLFFDDFIYFAAKIFLYFGKQIRVVPLGYCLK
jgi:hypothetical protein